MAPRLELHLLDGRYAVCQLPPGAPIPGWADGEGFVGIARTAEELSIVCLAARVPADIKSDGGWRCFKFQGPFAFDQTGILAAVLQPLAQAGVGIFAVSTYDTDYLLVKASQLPEAAQALAGAGHRIHAPQAPEENL